ncbi:MAG: TetR/AcrR family transcriptional regulator [Methylobacteriaceae bacterium]|nr:TetR/AcrR family transcriptional regulator [Methylobacteriaceae bacterium]MBV9634424.1 TetR/AcrR family transcriptional regulator [Methylobacteriaceae bacterium]MBV9702332.1 TetR/AcrR family transcriptional regulator [Methylobacteriaceae bacterium]
MAWNAGRPAGAASIGTRDRIKRVATELLVKHGFRGTNFRTIAERLATTTTNIHYHFGTKSRLVEEVVRDYVADAGQRQKRIWLDDSASLREKLRNAAAINHQRHRKFNRGTRTNRPWSLIGRLRLEIDVLTPGAVAVLGTFTTDVNTCVRAAVDAAARRGELRADAPLDHITVLLAAIVNSGAVLSQDAGSLEGLDKLFEALDQVILLPYTTSMRPRLMLIGD